MDNDPMTPIHILVVDDDPEIRELLKEYLERNGLRVTAVAEGRAMQRVLDNSRVDLVILDIMLPGRDGLTLCRDLRARSKLPVIMLTARGDETDRIVGLEMGADDYLAKPFSPRELLARIKAVLRRIQEGQPAEGIEQARQVHFGQWILDVQGHQLIDPDGVVVPLSSSEYRLLRVLLEYPNRVLTRDQLADLLRGRDWDPDDRSIDVQISRLRRRLRDQAREPSLIKTMRGEGYLLATEVQSHP